MKKLFSITVIFLLIITAGCETSPQEEVKTTLDEIISLLQKGNFSDDDIEQISGYLVYRGPDASRKWKDVMNPADEEEKALVRDFMNEMHNQLKTANTYEYGEFRTEEESEGIWYVQEVTMANGLQYYFAMLRVNDAYVIGDIDTSK